MTNLWTILFVFAILATLATFGVLIWISTTNLDVCKHDTLCGRELLYVGYPDKAATIRLYGSDSGHTVPAAVVIGVDPVTEELVTLGHSYSTARQAHPRLMGKLHNGEAMDFIGNLVGRTEAKTFRLYPHASEPGEAMLELFPDTAHSSMVPLRLMRANDVARLLAAAV
jgi:hypothetical protein